MEAGAGRKVVERFANDPQLGREATAILQARTRPERLTLPAADHATIRVPYQSGLLTVVPEHRCVWAPKWVGTETEIPTSADICTVAEALWQALRALAPRQPPRLADPQRDRRSRSIVRFWTMYQAVTSASLLAEGRFIRHTQAHSVPSGRARSGRSRYGSTTAANRCGRYQATCQRLLRCAGCYRSVSVSTRGACGAGAWQ